MKGKETSGYAAGGAVRIGRSPSGRSSKVFSGADKSDSDVLYALRASDTFCVRTRLALPRHPTRQHAVEDRDEGRVTPEPAARVYRIPRETPRDSERFAGVHRGSLDSRRERNRVL